jgi:hypothetical protein
VALGTEVEAVTTHLSAYPDQLVAETSAVHWKEFEFAENGSPDQVYATYYNFVGMLHDLLSDGLARDASRYDEQQRSFRALFSCLR